MSKWTYAELLRKHKSLVTKTYGIYIPELFDALKEEKPDWYNQELENRIIRDLRGIIRPRIIKRYRPKVKPPLPNPDELQHPINDGGNKSLDNF